MGWLIACIMVIAVMAFLGWASADIGSSVYLKTICKLNTHEKVIALTFDDGPHPVTTPQILDILKEYEAKATFFTIGKNIDGNEALIKRILAEGHTVGNHSYSHSPAYPLLGKAKMIADLTQCSAKISAISGSNVVLARPPFGVTNPTIAKAYKQLGLKAIGWNIRSLDTTTTHTSKTVKRVTNRLKPGAIILLHDHLPNSPEVLKQILYFCSQQHYKIVSLQNYI